MTEPSHAEPTGNPSDDAKARVAALRRNAGPPAQAARVLTAGLAGSMMLGMIAAMGWSDTRAEQAITASAPASTTPPSVAPTSPAPASPAPTDVAVVVPTVPPPVAAVPVTAAPVTAAPVAAVIEVPVATPVATAPPIATAPPVAQTRQSD
jgi:DNA polymerase-3 subunit gamma/tau